MTYIRVEALRLVVGIHDMHSLISIKYLSRNAR